jgi:hypothetical protein
MTIDALGGWCMTPMANSISDVAAGLARVRVLAAASTTPAMTGFSASDGIMVSSAQAICLFLAHDHC